MRIYSLIFILLLVGCKDSGTEAMDLNDIQAQSENYKEGAVKKDSTTETVIDIPLNLNLDLLSEIGINCQKISLSDTLLFPDRFSPIHLNKFNYTTENKPINFSKFNFKDSNKTTNVFLNWTNCFGQNCKSIRIGESKNLQKNGFLMMVNDTCIVYISTNSSSEKKNWIKYFTHEKDIQWKYILDQNKQGKVKWQNYIDNSFSVIEAITERE